MGEKISWQIKFIDLPEMVVSNMEGHRVVIMSLSAWTFYIPYRILCQLVAHQVIPTFQQEDFVMPLFNYAGMKVINVHGEAALPFLEILITVCCCLEVMKNGL